MDLQSIELVWAIVKGEVGRQYTTLTSFAEVKTRLETAFSNLGSKQVQGCINKANKHLECLQKFIWEIDDMDEEAEAEDKEDRDTSTNGDGSDEEEKQ